MKSIDDRLNFYELVDMDAGGEDDDQIFDRSGAAAPIPDSPFADAFSPPSH
jgi:hypothetical protein